MFAQNGTQLKAIFLGADQIWPPVVSNGDIEITVVTMGNNQTVSMTKYFTNAYTVDWGDGSPTTGLTADTTKTYNTTGTYIITLSLTGGATRWTFQNMSIPLVPQSGTTASNVYISKMPSLINYFGDSESMPGNYFFNYFNFHGALTSLPAGSFDTSYIDVAEDSFFDSFNAYGSLTSLPSGSFDTSNLSGWTGAFFFQGFNQNGNLTSLPNGSFNINNIAAVGYNFFGYFNQNGALTSLPTGSFNISNINGMVGDRFFSYFNDGGSLISLPEGSFNIDNITYCGNSFFDYFNARGSLTSLPIGSFNTSNLNAEMGYDFFTDFNFQGSLTKLDNQSGQIKNTSLNPVTFNHSPGNVAEEVPAGGYFRYTIA